MATRMTLRFLLPVGLFLVGTFCGAAEDRSDPVFLGGGSFEDPAAVEWFASGDAKGEISTEHATHGSRSFKLDVSTGTHPGIGIDFPKPMDFSPYYSLRFSLFNGTGQTLKMTIRVNDAGSTKGVASLYMLDPPMKVDPGPHEIEVPVGSMRQGTMLSRGLDVDRITAMRLFFNPVPKSSLVYFDNIRLVPAVPAGPEVQTLADFTREGPAKWAAHEAEGTIALSPASGVKALKLDLQANSNYPGVNLTRVPSNWLSYDLLCLDVVCPGEAPPGSLGIKVTDADGRQQTLSTPLAKGANHITVPTEVISWIGAGNVAAISFWAAPGDEKRTIFIEGIRLRRVKHQDLPNLHMPADPQSALIADFNGPNAARNTCYYAFVWVPLTDGSYRFIRCNSAGRDTLTYGIPASALDGLAKDKPLRAWTYLSDHGVWSFCDTTIKYEGKPVTFGFDAKGRAAF